MTVPAFGFSAGDFVSAVNLIVEITNALKNTGGAAGDYLQVLADLNLLRDVLSQLQQQQTGATRQISSNPFAEHARKPADLTLSTLANFLDLISKFDASLGPQRSSAWYRGVGRKAQWALVYSKHVDDLRSRIGTQIQTLSLVTQLQEDDRNGLDELTSQLNTIRVQNEQVITHLRERRIISIEELRRQLSLLDLRDDEQQPDSVPTLPEVVEDSQSILKTYSGVKTTLQFDFFRHWANVDMFLNKQFENCPGQQYIAKRQYFFLGADAATNKLNSNVEMA
ncbi:hypothetical protein FNAPI_2254 [Fusarium napiforme]|uniref:Ubiquitin-like domain-containing protein n=1 Tax=Fusarium napiforme TaxID=42672 RepID=A0A8H5NF21_9HYPO|nr:hypothetical protein FNAPI_2254 [Fusarium napiforme]